VYGIVVVVMISALRSFTMFGTFIPTRVSALFDIQYRFFIISFQILLKYIRIDFMGHYRSTVDMPPGCDRNLKPYDNEACFKLIGHRYKFFFAFENSDCEDYTTEKVFRNSFHSGMIPVVCVWSELSELSSSFCSFGLCEAM
jgi:hypothetical protein